MQVKCIDDDRIRNFTKINKIHEVISETEKYYLLKIGDLDYSLLKKRFKVMYTSEEIKKGKFAVEIDNEQDWIKFKEEFNNICTKFVGHGIYFPNSGWANLNSSYCKAINYTVLTFDQIEFMEEFVLPEQWFIKSTPENYKIIKKWLIENNPSKCSWDFYLINDKKYLNYDFTHTDNYNYLIQVGRIEITTEQFLRYVLKENNMEKIVVGYKLIKPEYEKAALRLCKVSTFLINKNYDLGYNSTNAQNLKEADVLDLWFEKVYENEYFKKGDWITIINLSEQTDNHNILNKTFQIQNVEEKGFKGNEDVRYVINDECGGIYHRCVRLATKEEIKASQVIKVQMTSTSGNFEIEVSKGKIYYRPDNKELSLEFIKFIIYSFVKYDDQISAFPYKIVTDTVTVGCKSGTTLECWKKVLEAYNSFQ